MLWYRLIGIVYKLFGFNGCARFIAAVRLFVPGKRDGLVAIAGARDTRPNFERAILLLKFYRLEHLLRKQTSCGCDLCLETERLFTGKTPLMTNVAVEEQPRCETKETEAAAIMAETNGALYGSLKEVRTLISSAHSRAS